MSLPEELRAARPAGPRGLGGAASTWSERHAQSLVGSLGRLARQPFATALTVAVIGIALALPTALYLVVENMRAMTAGLGETVQLSVYLRQPTTAEQARRVADAMRARVEVQTAVLVSPDEGLAEFRAMSGIGEALEALTENPLPWVVQHPAAAAARFGVRGRGARGGAAQGQGGRAGRGGHGLGAPPALRSWTRCASSCCWSRAVLAAGVLAIVGNTIRLEINGRRAEIEVTKLVGGSNAFVRRPFLYSGFWQGLAGGLLASRV